MSYEFSVPENIVGIGERRRVVNPDAPRRRTEDRVESTLNIPKPGYISAREEELYALIDGHIARLQAAAGIA
jgi:hypothetical protein